MQATALPPSKPLPPPKAIMPSQLFLLKQLTPSVTFVPVGLPTTLEYNSTKIPFYFKLFKTSITICDLARPLSVTNNGLLILRVLQALLKSLILSFPTHIVVG